jgi:hypothetical protein
MLDAVTQMVHTARRRAGPGGSWILRPIVFAATACLLTALSAAGAQPAQYAALPDVSTPSQAEATLTAQQLQHLVAPIALYPDQVLTDILAAATFPAQVVEARRFTVAQAHAGLKGAALAQAAAGQDWDPSVKALLMFPQLLQMMDTDLEWTEHLGRAFIAQQADVMNAVQLLRLAAEKYGKLASGPNATVVNEGGDIAIDPPAQQDFYLPAYQPDCVFGPNPACDGAETEIYWASGVLLPYGYPQWGFLDWGHREIRRANSGSIWRLTNLQIASGGFITRNPVRFNNVPPAAFSPRIIPGSRFNAAPRFLQARHEAAATHAAPGPGHR